VAASLGRHLRPEPESWFAKVANRVAAILQPAPAPTPENVIDEPMRISGKLVALTAIFGLTATADEVVEHVPTAEELENLDARLAAAFAAEERVNELTTELEAANAALVAAEALAAEYGATAGAQPTALPKGDDPDTINTAGLTSWERKMELKKQNLR
jgi:hypothetical protein